MNVFNNVILARNRQLPDDVRMIKTCRSVFKSFNINNLSVCIGWCADQVTLRSARCSDKDLYFYLHINPTQYTGSFEMIVGVLTTCHTQYIWDRSICIFLFNRTTYRAPIRYVTKTWNVLLLNKKIHILQPQVYCVWQVVKTLTIISNNPVFNNRTSKSKFCHPDCGFRNISQSLQPHLATPSNQDTTAAARNLSNS